MINSCNKYIKTLKPYNVYVLPENIKRMNANESATPILDYDILMQNVDEKLNFYPERKAVKLVEQASKFYKIDTKNIIATNGSDEGIDLCIRTFCNTNDAILVFEPTFSMYKQYAEVFGVKTDSIDITQRDNDWFFDENIAIKKAQENNARMLFIANPLANIGEIITKDKLVKIIKSLPNTIIVIDEAYIEFCGLENSLINEINNYQNLVILRTFSKFFGLAGIRLGFIFTNFKDEIMKIKSPYNVNSITCQIGINVFENITTALIKQRQKEFLQKRIALTKWLQTFDEIETIFKSDTNFVFIKLSCKANIFAIKLEKEFNIKIKAMSGKFDNYCRISVL